MTSLNRHLIQQKDEHSHNCKKTNQRDKYSLQLKNYAHDIKTSWTEQRLLNGRFSSLLTKRKSRAKIARIIVSIMNILLIFPLGVFGDAG